MNCAMCDAPLNRSRTHCIICGYACLPETDKKWDRSVEAVAFEDLGTVLEAEESLLGLTRGRIAGNWRGRLVISPQTIFSRYINVGLTASRLLLQPIQISTGRAVPGKATAFPLEQIASVSLSDADPMEAGRTVRVVIGLESGEAMPLRATGRLADGARELVEVWETLSGRNHVEQSAPRIACPTCGRDLDRPYKYCPFCGHEIGEEA